MARFTINPPNTKLTDGGGFVTSDWYRWFSRVHDVLGTDAVAAIAAAPVLTHAATSAFSDDKVLTQGSGLSFTSGASTLTVALAASGVTAASYGSASQVASFTVDTFGRLTAAANVTITPAAIGAAAASLTLTAGAGLTGGGDLTANRTFDVGAGTGITVNANDVALDTTSTRNTDHASVTLTAGAGLTGGGDITASRTFDIGAGTGITVNANDVALDTASTRNTDHAGVTLTAGAGLTGGGTIESSRTFDVGAGTGITVNADDVALDTASTRNTDHASVTLTAGAGLTGGGDISANRTFAVGAGTGITVNADDVAIDSTVVTLTGSQTLTNKTLTSPAISGGTIDNAVIGGTTAAAGTFTTLTTSGKVTVVDALTGGQLTVSDSSTDATGKNGSFAVGHYTNSEEPVLGMGVQSNSGTSLVLIGGAYGQFNAATEIRFYTAATATTTTGTQRWTLGGTSTVGFLRPNSGSFGRAAPVTKTADFTVAETENWLINNKSGSSCTVTLPTASTWTGREIMIQNYQAQTVVSASSNVVPLGGGAAATAILAASAGAWATLVSDGTNWVIMQAA